MQGSRSPGSTGLRWLAACLGASALVLAVLLAVSWSNGGSILPQPARSGPASPATLTVTGIDRHVIYEENTSGSIGPDTNYTCPQCPFSFPAGSVVSFTFFTVHVTSSIPTIAMKIFVNTTIPAVPFGGYSCPGSSPCSPPAVTSSDQILIVPNGYDNGWVIIFDPPANTTAAADGPVSVTVFVASCSNVNTDWNYCG